MMTSTTKQTSSPRRLLLPSLWRTSALTADVPLAAQVIAKGAVVIDPRGELLDKGNIQERLSMRNFMETLRNSGVETGGPASLSAADRQAFANQLDRLLSGSR